MIAPAAAAALPPQRFAELTQAARNFESMALGQLLEPMFATVDPSAGPFGGGDGEKQWQSFFVAEIAKKIEAGGGFGLAQPVLAAMIRMQEAKDHHAA